MDAIQNGYSSAAARLSAFFYTQETPQSRQETEGSDKARVFQPLDLPHLTEEPRVQPLGEKVVAISTSTKTYFVDVTTNTRLGEMDRDWTYLSHSGAFAYFKSYGGRLRCVDIASGQLQFEILAKTVSPSYSLKHCFGLPGGECVTVSNEGIYFWTSDGKSADSFCLPGPTLRGAELVGDYIYVWVTSGSKEQELYGVKTSREKTGVWKVVRGLTKCVFSTKADTAIFMTGSRINVLDNQEQCVESFEVLPNFELRMKWRAPLKTVELSESLRASWCPIRGNLTMEGRGEGRDFLALHITEEGQRGETWIFDKGTGKVLARTTQDLKNFQGNLVGVDLGVFEVFRNRVALEDNRPEKWSCDRPAATWAGLMGSWGLAVEHRDMAAWYSPWSSLQYTVGRLDIPPPRLNQRRAVMTLAALITAVMLTRILYRRYSASKPIVAVPLPKESGMPIPLPPVAVPLPQEPGIPLPPPPVAAPPDPSLPPRPYYVMPPKRELPFPLGNLHRWDYFMNHASY